MVTAWCQHSTFGHLIPYEYVFLTCVFSIGLIALLCAAYQHTVTHFGSDSSSSSSSLFGLSVAYYLVLILYFIDLIMHYQYYCSNASMTVITGVTAYYLYWTQMLLLLILFFYRLVFMFDGSEYAVSKRTLVLSTAAILSDAALFFAAYTFLRLSDRLHFIWVLALAFSLLFAICLIISLNVAFIRKLAVVHATCNDSPSDIDKLPSLITKMTVLCLVASCMSCVYISFLFVWNEVLPDMHLDLIFHLILFNDLYTNFLSVLLAVKRFERYYFCLCGCCHRSMISCCSHHAIQTEAQMGQIVIQHTSAN